MNMQQKNALIPVAAAVQSAVVVAPLQCQVQGAVVEERVVETIGRESGSDVQHPVLNETG